MVANIIKVLLTVKLMFILCTSIYTQTDFKDGSIMYNDSTTVVGMIDVRDLHSLSKKVTFKNNMNEEILFVPGLIKGYELSKDRKFATKGVNGTLYFMQVLFEGKINLYLREDYKGKKRFYVSGSDDVLNEIVFEKEIITSEDGRFLQSSTQHIETLSKYMYNAPNTLEQIKKVSPDYDNLISLFSTYHNEVCPNDKCYIYKNNTPKAIIYFEPVYALVNLDYDNTNSVSSISSFFGGYINLKLPRQGRSSYIRLGLISGREQLFVDNKDQTRNLTIITAHGMYVYPKGILRPKVSFGFYYNTEPAISLGGMLGLNIQLKENFCLTTSADVLNVFSVTKNNFKSSYILNFGMQFKI